MLYNRLAEVAREYLKKGNRFMLKEDYRPGSGRIKMADRYTTEIVGDNMQMLGSRAGQVVKLQVASREMSQGLQ